MGFLRLVAGLPLGVQETGRGASTQANACGSEWRLGGLNQRTYK